MPLEVRGAADGKQELAGETAPSALYNRDLAPTPIRLRAWGLYSYLAFWVGTAVVIPSWSLANVGLVFGFDWLTSVLTVILGNVIVTVPLLLNSHVGAKYGVPFPVFSSHQQTDRRAPPEASTRCAPISLRSGARPPLHS